MHMRHFRLHVPVHPKLRLFWDRVTFSKLTTIYFCFSIIHCIVQVVFQVQAFGVNNQAVSFLSGLIKQGNATAPGFTVFNGKVLRVCEVVPQKASDASSCPIVWGASTTNSSDNAQLNAQPIPVSSSIGSSASSSFSSTVASASVSSIVSSSSVPTSVSASSASASESSVASSASSTNGTNGVFSSSLSSSSSSASPHSLSSSSVSSAASSTGSSERSGTVVFPIPTPPPPPPIPTGIKAEDTDVVESTVSVTVTVRLSPSQQVSSLNNVANGGKITAGGAETAGGKTGTDTNGADSGVSDSGKIGAQVTTLDNAASGSPTVEEDKINGNGRQGTRVTTLTAPMRRDNTSAGTISIPNRNVTVQLGGLYGLHEANLTEQCLFTLNWPVVSVENTKREDIAFVMFQFWLLGMSLVALLNESIPHVVASLLTHTLATAWAGFQIFNTEQFHSMFSHLTTHGACGINLLPDYWTARGNAEIPSLVLNCVAFFFSGFLTWKLMKAFGWQTFKRVGASRTINRVYNAVLILSIAIQLALYFVATFAALWLDQVLNGSIGRLTHTKVMFIAICIIVLVLLVPWLTLGWISVRREHKFMALTFLLLSLAYLGGWAAMFTAATFRWTFVQWTFFSLIASASVLLTFMTFVVGIICFFNFGKGLPRYLQAQEPLADDFAPGIASEKGDIEKAEFPSNDLPIPTFSATFGSGSEVPPPSQMRFGPPGRRLGPRFYNQPEEPFDAEPELPYPGDLVSSLDYQSDSTLARSDSGSSSKSGASTEGSTSGHSTRSKRWVIE